MQSDRELLELAAKAAGIQLPAVGEYEYAGPGELLPNSWGILTFMGLGRVQFWNPLADDGDALRLAVKLRMDVKQWNSLAIATKAWNKHAEENTSTQCPYAATRRAITRAAAQLAQARDGK